MLVVGRRQGGGIVLNTKDGVIRVTVLRLGRTECRIGVDAPRTVDVCRDDAQLKERKSQGSDRAGMPPVRSFPVTRPGGSFSSTTLTHQAIGVRDMSDGNESVASVVMTHVVIRKKPGTIPVITRCSRKRLAWTVRECQRVSPDAEIVVAWIERGQIEVQCANDAIMEDEGYCDQSS